jgi:tetratricopeptide (TPR) repeat protein
MQPLLGAILGIPMEFDQGAQQQGDGAPMETEPTQAAEPAEPAKAAKAEHKAEHKPEPKAEPPKRPHVVKEQTEEEKRAAEAANAAGAEKEAGNKLFAEKKFDQALAHYDKAVQLEPTNAVHRSNRATTLFQLGRVEDSLAECKEAEKVGKENFCDYKLVRAAAAAAPMAMQLLTDGCSARQDLHPHGYGAGEAWTVSDRQRDAPLPLTLTGVW